MVKVFIGTSGWQYDHWRSVFYPQDLPQKEWLLYYRKYFDTVEVNATFYHQMKKETFAKWRETVGPDFVFAIKGSRFITHIKRLKDCQEGVERFFEAVVGLFGPAVTNFSVATPAVENNNPVLDTSLKNNESLRSKCGSSKIVTRRPWMNPRLIPNYNVVLWQLPPRFAFDKLRLKRFLTILLKTSHSLRQAFEFRDQSWLNEETYSLLKKYNCALVIQDSPNWPAAEVVTADFVYLRFHGRQSLYASCYSEKELDEWAAKVRHWLKKGLDVYGFFNNDSQGYAIKNGLRLKELLGH